MTDSMTCITHAFRATHTLVMLMGKHTIVAKRAIIFNPENSLIFSLSVSSIDVMNWMKPLNEFLSDGSQLDSLSFPGLSSSVLVFNPGDASVLLYVTIKIQKIK